MLTKVEALALRLELAKFTLGLTVATAQSATGRISDAAAERKGEELGEKLSDFIESITEK